MLYMKVRKSENCLVCVYEYLYFQEMRPIVQAECTLKESAAINQILGRRVSKYKNWKYTQKRKRLTSQQTL